MEDGQAGGQAVKNGSNHNSGQEVTRKLIAWEFQHSGNADQPTAQDVRAKVSAGKDDRIRYFVRSTPVTDLEKRLRKR